MYEDTGGAKGSYCLESWPPESYGLPIARARTEVSVLQRFSSTLSETWRQTRQKLLGPYYWSHPVQWYILRTQDDVGVDWSADFEGLSRYWWFQVISLLLGGAAAFSKYWDTQRSEGDDLALYSSYHMAQSLGLLRVVTVWFVGRHSANLPQWRDFTTARALA